MTPFITLEKLQDYVALCYSCHQYCQHKVRFLCPVEEVEEKQVPVLLHHATTFGRIILAECAMCHALSYDLYRNEQSILQDGNTYALYKIYPPIANPNIPQPNNDMPEGIKNLYNEAALIFDLSPRSAAVLLRLCVQRLLQACGYKGSIHKMLKDAKEIGTDMDLITMMDACREIGNYSAHEEPELSQEKIKNTRLLFKALNIIVRHYQTWEKDKKEVASQLAPTSSLSNTPS